MFKDISKGNFLTRVNKSQAITFYPPFEREENGVKYLYGVVGKGISFHDKDEIRVRDSQVSNIEATAKDKLYDYNTNQYLFVPSVHRLALIKEGVGTATIQDLEKYLEEHMSKFLKADEKLVVEVEKEPRIIEEIFNARKVFTLSYEISYSNSDALNPQGQLFDKKLKKAKIGKLKVEAEADHNAEGMDLDEEILGGGLDLAKRNGQVKSAKILPLNSDKIIRVTNSDKVKTLEFQVASENDNRIVQFFKTLLRIYA